MSQETLFDQRRRLAIRHLYHAKNVAETMGREAYRREASGAIPYPDPWHSGPLYQAYIEGYYDEAEKAKERVS